MIARVNERRLTLLAELETRYLKENILRETQESILTELEDKLREVRLPPSEIQLVFRGDSEQLEELISDSGEVFEWEIPAIPNYQQLRASISVGKGGLGDGGISKPHAVAVDQKCGYRGAVLFEI